MDQNFKIRLKALATLTSYGFALYHAGANLDKAAQVNDNFDAKAAMMVAGSSATGTASFVNLNPYSVVDNQYFNAAAFYGAITIAKNESGKKG